jgi:hypothetical protein
MRHPTLTLTVKLPLQGNKTRAGTPVPASHYIEQLHGCSICGLYTRKLNNEKSKYAGLEQQNGFDPKFYKRHSKA